MRPLDLILVSGTSTGGAARSTHELADALVRSGQRVRVLTDSREPDRTHRLYKRAVNLSTKLRRRRSTRGLARLVEKIHAQFGSRPYDEPRSRTYSSRIAPIAENALPRLIHERRPDAVVVCSIERVGWLRILDVLRSEGILSSLYFREQNSIGHLAISGAPPDVLLSNAESHADAARRLGHACTVIPSVVHLDPVRTETSRQRLLVVNIDPAYGIELVKDIAEQLGDIPITLQESWPTSPEHWSALAAWASSRPDVELRRRADDPAHIYRDPRLLLVAVQSDTRPRTILEAGVNGIPVITYDRPALREAGGGGGVYLDESAGAGDWAGAIREVWDSDERYDDLRRAAAGYAEREDIRPEVIAENLVDAIRSGMTGDSGTGSGSG